MTNQPLSDMAQRQIREWLREHPNGQVRLNHADAHIRSMDMLLPVDGELVHVKHTPVRGERCQN